MLTSGFITKSNILPIYKQIFYILTAASFQIDKLGKLYIHFHSDIWRGVLSFNTAHKVVQIQILLAPSTGTYSQHTELNTFSMSKLITTALLFYLITLSTTCNICLILSCVCLSCTKPVWSSSNYCGSMF